MAIRIIYLFLILLFTSCEELEVDEDSIFEADSSEQIPEVTQINETITGSSASFAWQGNEYALEFSYKLITLSYSDSVYSDWSDWTTERDTPPALFSFLDEGDYMFIVKSRFDDKEEEAPKSINFEINNIEGPALRIYPLSQTANVDDVIDVYLYFEEVPEDSSVTGLHVGIQVNTDEFEFMSDYPDSLNVEDDGIRYGELITDFFGTTITPDPIYSHSEDDPIMAVLSIMGVAVDSSGTGIYGTGSIAKFRLKVLTCCEPQNINIYQQDLLNINGDAHSFNEPVSGSVTVESVLQ